MYRTVTSGEYTHHKSVSNDKASLVPCSDMCGVVTEVGSGVSKWKKGDRVLSTFLPDHQTGQVVESMMASGMGLPQQGVLAQYRAFKEYALVKTISSIDRKLGKKGRLAKSLRSKTNPVLLASPPAAPAEAPAAPQP